LAISTLWTYWCFLLTDEDNWKDPYFDDDAATSSQSQNDKADWGILVAIVLLVGVLPNALFFIWKGFRDVIRSIPATFDKATRIMSWMAF